MTPTDIELERVRDEEFPNTILSRASNNSPRGLWSDGDVMYVVDASDGKVYTYNMPDAIDARLASLTLSGVDIGEFASDQPEYEGVVDDGVTVTTIEAAATQDDAVVVIDPPDADEAADGRQVAVGGGAEITVTVTSADGSRKKTYSVRIEETGPSATCLRGAIDEGFSLVVSEGGSIDDLEACAEGRAVTALYTLSGGEYVSYILGARRTVNERFVALYADGLTSLTPLIAKSEGPPSPAPESDDVPEFGPDCLRGEIVHGLQPRALRGRQRRRPRGLRAEPRPGCALHAARGCVRVLHPRRPGLRERGVRGALRREHRPGHPADRQA